MIIRKANINDVNDISQLIQKVTDINPNNYSMDQINAWNKCNTPSEIEKQLNDRIIFCAITENTLIGTIALKGNYVVGFYVNQSFSKMGIGTKLLTFLEKYAFDNNLKKLKLTSTPYAFNFYKNRDYKINKKIILSFYGVDYPEVEMEKTLKSI